MTPDFQTIMAIGLPAAGLLVTWGGLLVRMRQVEKQVGKIEPLEKQVATIDTRTRESAASQGTRIGKAQSAVDVLTGRFHGLEIGVRGWGRTPTAALGNPTVDEGGRV